MGKKGCTIIVIAISCLFLSGTVQGEVGVTDTEIKLGYFGALTGPAAVVCRPINEGMKLYVDYINDQGGVYGRKIKFISEDDQFLPSRAKQAAKKLILQDKVFAIWMVIQGGGVLAAEPIIMANKVPTLSGSAIEPLYIPPKRYIFGVNLLYGPGGALLSDWAVKRLGKKKIAVTGMSGPTGEAGIKGARDRLKKYELEPVLEERLKNIKMDYSGLIAKMRRKGADCVLITNTIQWTIPILNEIERQGWRPAIVIGHGSGDPLLLAKMAKSAVEGAYVAMVNIPVDTPDDPFLDEYRAALKKYGKSKSISQYNSMGWGTVQLFVTAIKQVGRDLTREKLVDTMESWKDFDTGWIGRITYSPTDHIGSECLPFVKMVGGKAQIVERALYLED